MEYPKLPPEFKQKWLQALRSGEYNQGNGQLVEWTYKENEEGEDIREYPIGYCCLGVACKVAGIDDETMEDYAFIDWETPLAEYDIPKELKGDSDDNPVAKLLAHMNDGTGEFIGNKQSFSAIADWIEENL